MDFRGKRILISGASTGIGLATARQFHQAGATVLLLARRQSVLEEIRSELGSRCQIWSLDLTDDSQMEAFLNRLPLPIDVLVNNAGCAVGLEPAWECRYEDWKKTVDLNIHALLRLTLAILPQMVAADRGHIINLGSIAGSYPYPGGHVYGASKAFLEQFSLCLRSDLHGKRVRVTNIEPGIVKTDFSLARFQGDQARADATYEGIEAMQPEDIAEAICWCAALPERVNVNRLEVMATMQSPAGIRYHRTPTE